MAGLSGLLTARSRWQAAISPGAGHQAYDAGRARLLLDGRSGQARAGRGVDITVRTFAGPRYPAHRFSVVGGRYPRIANAPAQYQTNRSDSEAPIRSQQWLRGLYQLDQADALDAAPLADLGDLLPEVVDVHLVTRAVQVHVRQRTIGRRRCPERRRERRPGRRLSRSVQCPAQQGSALTQSNLAGCPTGSST
jgi:hypothetical protein